MGILTLRPTILNLPLRRHQMRTVIRDPGTKGPAVLFNNGLQIR